MPGEARYKEAYALVIDAHKMTRDEHEALLDYLYNLKRITNGFTPYESYVDTEYADDIIPIDEQNNVG